MYVYITGKNVFRELDAAPDNAAARHRGVVEECGVGGTRAVQTT